MIRVAVCDDEPLMLRQLSEQIIGFFEARGIPVELSRFSGGEQLLAAPSLPDLLFLDVQMPAMSGFDAALALRRKGFDGFLVFITVLREEVFRAFEVQAFDYLVKPVEDAALHATMERLLHAIHSRQGERLLVRRGSDCSLVPFRQITYCEVISRKVYLHLHGAPVLDYYEKLDVLEQQLDGRFFRCHRSYLINLQYLKSCRSGFVELSTGEKVPVSRLRRERLAAAVLQYMKNWGAAL